MKYTTSFLSVLVLIVMACNKHKDVKTLSEDYSISEIEQMYRMKFDTSDIFDEKLYNESLEIPEDTLKRALKVNYGPDDRKDLYQETDDLKRKNAPGVVAMVSTSDLKPLLNGKYQLLTVPFKRALRLCNGVAFSSQPKVSTCTGFAVAPHIIITAGHCITSIQGFNASRFLYDYVQTDSLNFTSVYDRTMILTPKRIIDRRVTNGYDYAIIETNETIPEERILKLNIQNTISDRQFLYVIGYPSGLPMKIAGNAHVRDNTNPLTFTANLDTFGGNSGSPVINEDTHLVEGILVKGEVDFIPNGTCNIIHPCPDNGCSGEVVSRVSQFKQKIAPYITN